MPRMDRPGRRCLGGTASLSNLPDEIVDLIVGFLVPSLPAQGALARTSVSFRDAVARLRVNGASLRSSSLFSRSRLWAPHYSRDLRVLSTVLNDPRFTYLRRLTLHINTPSFAVGGGRKVALPVVGALRQLHHFKLNCMLSRQLHSRLPTMSAPALARMLQWMPHLITLRVADVPNLGHGFFGALRRIRGLRELSLSRCTLIAGFAEEFGRDGLLTGATLPRDLTTLSLDVANLNRALRAAWKKDNPPLFLSGLTNLVDLELSETAEALTLDVWYALRCIGSLARTLAHVRSTSLQLCALFDFAKDVVGSDAPSYKVWRCNPHRISAA